MSRMNKNALSKSIILEKKPSGSYVFSCNDSELVPVAFFLCYDYSPTFRQWVHTWIADPSSDVTGCNESGLTKIDGKIELSWLLDEQDEYKVYFSPNEFIHMINTWEEITSKASDRIRLTLETTDEGNKVKFESIA